MTIRVARPRRTDQDAAELLRRLQDGETILILNARTTPAEEAPIRWQLPPRLDHPGIVIATSGTEGQPKLAFHRWDRLQEAARAQAAHVRYETGCTWATALPLSSIGGLMVAVRAHVTGGAFRFWPRWDPDVAAADLKARRVTHISVAPQMLDDLTTSKPPQDLVCALVGGGPPIEASERARQAGWPAAPSYGFTEAAATVAALPPWFRDPHGPSCGPPVPGVEVRADGRGQLLVRSNHAAVGLLRETHLEPLPEWYGPGDVGLVDEAGHVHVEGRQDRSFTTGGFTLDPAELERAIRRHAAVRDVVVLPLPDERLGFIAVAAVEADELAVGELNQILEATLAPPKRPRKIVIVPSLPRRAGGKLDEAAIRDLIR